MAAYAESHSSYPIAKSIKEAFDQEVGNKRIKEYQEISGHGIKAVVDDKEIMVSNIKLMSKEAIKSQKVNEDGTIAYLAIDKKFAGYIIITEELKENSIKAINDLKKHGTNGLKMLTGDRKAVARSVAQRLGLNKYYAELLSDHKVKKVEELLSQQSKNDKLVFVGDGINDAFVLARSDIGAAMEGFGSNAAIEAADVVLMSEKPSKSITAVNTTQRTKKLFGSGLRCERHSPMGTLGIATMWEAVFADVGVELSAVLYALRISRNVK